jgi:hypothetical protein
MLLIISDMSQGIIIFLSRKCVHMILTIELNSACSADEWTTKVRPLSCRQQQISKNPKHKFLNVG